MQNALNEATLESYALELLGQLNYTCKNAKELSSQTRKKDEWILRDDFIEAIKRINFQSKENYKFLSIEKQEQLALEAYKKILNLADGLEDEGLLHSNEKLHTYLMQGITLDILVDTEQRGIKLELLDFENIENNTFST